MDVILKINGSNEKVTIDPGEILLDTLHKLGYFSVKRGCSNAECGACTVIIDGKAVNSCLVFTASTQGQDIMTTEALGTHEQYHPLQKHFLKEGAVQCGYCIPGILMSSKALLDKNDNPTEKEIKIALNGNLCRCTGYVKQIKAVQGAAKELRKKND